MGKCRLIPFTGWPETLLISREVKAGKASAAYPSCSADSPAFLIIKQRNPIPEVWVMRKRKMPCGASTRPLRRITMQFPGVLEQSCAI